jgi:hypothetical protein
MSDNYKLKIKIGSHEFEAEGPADVVQKQFHAFQELIASIPEQRFIPSSADSAEEERYPNFVIRNTNTEPSVQDFSKIMKVEDRIVSLTVRPESLDDAVMLILLGQKELRTNELSTGGEIMQGLTATGGFPISRIDKTLAKLGRAGDVIVIGEHRAKKYRLTNAGLTRVRRTASALLATVS